MSLIQALLFTSFLVGSAMCRLRQMHVSGSGCGISTAIVERKCIEGYLDECLQSAPPCAVITVNKYAEEHSVNKSSRCSS